MIASMFTLDARLAELRPSDAEQRLARQRRDAALDSHAAEDLGWGASPARPAAASHRAVFRAAPSRAAAR